MQSRESANKNDTWLFSKPLEIIYQVVPLLFFPIALYEIFARPNWGTNEIMWTRFVANTFLLNSLHVVLTFALILGSSALRNWVRESYKISIRQWLLRVSGILTLFLVLFWAAGAHFVVQTEWRQPFCFLLLLAGVIVPYFHSIWQIRGISTLYDEGKTSYLERYLINALFAVFVFSQIVHLLMDFPSALNVISPFIQKLQTLPLEIMRMTGVITGLLIASVIVAHSFARKGPHMKSRTLFLMRLFLFPMGAYSFVALAGTSAAHGLEYLAVFWKVSGAQPENEKKKIRKHGILSMIFLIPFMMPIYGVFWSIFAKNNFLEFISALGIAIVYTHYIVDGALYRMKDPATRKIVGPMLVEKN